MAKINKNREINFDFLSKEQIMELAKPKNSLEAGFLKDAINRLGDNTSVAKLAEYLGVSPRIIYYCIEDKKLVAFKLGSRKVILTKSILNIVDLDD